MNCRPHPYQGCALPTELPGQNSRLTHCGCSFCMHPPSLERVMGIEPTQSAWKAEVLPLNYNRITIDAPAQRATGSLRPAQRSPALRAFVEPLFRFSSSPTWPRRDTKLWWRGRITPRLRRSALRVAAPCAALSGASRLRRTSFRFSSSPTWPRRDTKLWWRGEDSNLRRLSRQIYSLIPLTAREPLQKRGGILWQGSGAVNWAYRPRRLLAVSTCGMRHGSIAALAGAHGQFPQSTAATGSNSRF